MWGNMENNRPLPILSLIIRITNMGSAPLPPELADSAICGLDLVVDGGFVGCGVALGRLTDR